MSLNPQNELADPIANHLLCHQVPQLIIYLFIFAVGLCRDGQSAHFNASDATQAIALVNSGKHPVTEGEVRT